MKYIKSLLVLAMFSILCSCSDLEMDVNAKMKVLPGRSLKVAGLTIINYEGMHKNVGVSFNVGGVEFVEQLRIPIIVVDKYKDSGIIPLRIDFAGRNYTIHCNATDGVAMTRKLSKRKYAMIKKYINSMEI